ncbi:OmpW/AlkL family protein [Roseovarius sp. 217]|uniref:OmpW/AlkL family protein n=1 Tax=Roseovarius sp. (strain 217) TaxID=314264 RepID=UPI000068496A|nr:OmpW family outer membrane protein [Roseovarius sp. 217]EAQ25911.1 OmpW [Roseovarius sp. 217]
MKKQNYIIKSFVFDIFKNGEEMMMDFVCEPGTVSRRVNRLRRLLFSVGFILLAIVLLAETSGTALAQGALTADEGWANRFLVRGRIAGVFPEDSAQYNVPARTHVSNQFIPEIDLSYFFTENIAAETICCITKHDVSLSGGPTLGEAWLIPLSVMAQYHFRPRGSIKPYIGAGPALVLVVANNERGPATSFNLETYNPGFVLQAGVDIKLRNNWYLNADIKKFFVDIDAKVTTAGGTVSGKASIDPIVAGIGIGYRF